MKRLIMCGIVITAVMGFTFALAWELLRWVCIILGILIMYQIVKVLYGL